MTFWRRFGRETSGAAATELALVLPGIAFILLNIVDLGIYTFVKMQVDLAAHEAVGAARSECDTAAELASKAACTGLVSAMTTGAHSTSLGNSVALTAPVAADWDYYCADSSGNLVLAKTSGVVWTNCSAAVSGSTAVPGLYIKATVTRTYTPVFPGASVASYLTPSMTKVAWMRLK
jgi:Flp pilus assembly protein TadG